MNICICDDDKTIQTTVKSFVSDFLQKRDFKSSITCFCSGSQFLKDWNANNNPLYDLYFLDIDMKEELSGLDLARTIQDRDQYAKIVFITAHSKHTHEALRIVHAFSYLIKPIKSEDIENTMEDFFHFCNPNVIISVLDKNQRKVNLPVEKILYIERKLRKSEFITTTGEVFYSYKTLSGLSDDLPSFFIRCHKGFIVNLNHAIDSAHGKCQLKNGEELAIGRKYQEGFKNIYMSFTRRSKC